MSMIDPIPAGLRLTADQLAEVSAMDMTTSDKGVAKGLMYNTSDPVELEYLRGLLATERPPRDRAPAPQVPWWDLTRSGDTRRQPLSAADVAWLSMLPTDPEQMTEADVRQVAQLALDADRATGDARLLDRIMRPLQERYEREVARQRVDKARAARAAQPSPPARAVPVTAAAIRRAVPALSGDEAAGRAQALIDAAVAKRTAKLDLAVVQAEQALARLEQDGPEPLSHKGRAPATARAAEYAAELARGR